MVLGFLWDFLEDLYDGVKSFFGIFSSTPDSDNETIRRIEESFQQKQQQSRLLQADQEALNQREADIKRREEEKLRLLQADLEALKLREADIKRREEEKLRLLEADLEALKLREADIKRREEQTSRQLESDQEALKQLRLLEADLGALKLREADIKRREEQASRQLEADQEALKQQEADIKRREEQASRQLEADQEAVKQQEADIKRREEEAQKTFAEASKAIKAHQQGIRPVIMPTREQLSSAKKRIKFDPKKLHFAICGLAGSGKSSLINSFRGMDDSDPGAAPVKVVECTSKVTRYPDPRGEIPFGRFVWYDIPGAGTIKVPDWQYFNDQGLFVFDFIILVYDARFTSTDVGIIQNCYRFKIPLFVVRSKADQHIDNMLKALKCPRKERESHRPAVTKKYENVTRSDFVEQVNRMVEKVELDERDQEDLLKLDLYIVSRQTVRCLFQGQDPQMEAEVDEEFIDEKQLVKDLLRAAARRRYSTRYMGGTSQQDRSDELSTRYLGGTSQQDRSDELSTRYMGGTSQQDRSDELFTHYMDGTSQQDCSDELSPRYLGGTSQQEQSDELSTRYMGATSQQERSNKLSTHYGMH